MAMTGYCMSCRTEDYRTLHSYNLIRAVGHLFPRQRWQTHTYSVSGNQWPGEPRDLCKTTPMRKFRPAFGTTSKTRIFYKYVVFKHSFSFTQFLRSGNTIPPAWWASQAFISSIYIDSETFSSLRETDCFKTQKEKDFKYVIQLNRTIYSSTFL